MKIQRIIISLFLLLASCSKKYVWLTPSSSEVEKLVPKIYLSKVSSAIENGDAIWLKIAIEKTQLQSFTYDIEKQYLISKTSYFKAGVSSACRNHAEAPERYDDTIKGLWIGPKSSFVSCYQYESGSVSFYDSGIDNDIIVIISEFRRK